MRLSEQIVEAVVASPDDRRHRLHAEDACGDLESAGIVALDGQPAPAALDPRSVVRVGERVLQVLGEALHKPLAGAAGLGRDVARVAD